MLRAIVTGARQGWSWRSVAVWLYVLVYLVAGAAALLGVIFVEQTGGDGASDAFTMVENLAMVFIGLVIAVVQASLQP